MVPLDVEKKRKMGNAFCSATSCCGNVKNRYFLPAEVAVHNTASDCWVSFNGGVYDLTDLCKIWSGSKAIKPILTFAGKDISHWFDEEKNDIKHHVEPETGLLVPYCPHGSVPDVPPYILQPTACNSSKRIPWWRDKNYKIGNLTKNPRPLNIFNTLTNFRFTIMVCEEESISFIQERALRFNSKAKSYIWKFDGREIDLDRTLTENGIDDERDRFIVLGLDTDICTPTIMCYYNEDEP